MLSVGSFVLGAADLPRAVAFWTRALHYVPRDDVDDEFVVLVPATGAGPQVALMPSETAPEERPRMHLDLYADDEADQAAQVERLLSLGAHLVDWPLYPPDPDFVVLADTEGNLFCIVDRSA